MESAELSLKDGFKIHVNSVPCLFRKKGNDAFISIFLQISFLFYKRKSKVNIHELRKQATTNLMHQKFYSMRTLPNI